MILHSEKLEGLERTLWELREMAENAGLPLPPPLQLPKLPKLEGGCDLNKLAERIGSEALGMLREHLALPDVRALLQGQLEAAKAKLLGYAGNLDRLKSEMLGQVQELLGDQGALGQGRELLGQLRGILGAGGPLGGPLLGAISEACPAVGGLMNYAESTLGALDGQIAGVQSMLGGLTSKLDAATNVQGLVSKALDELEGHITMQGKLFELLDNLPLLGGDA